MQIAILLEAWCKTAPCEVYPDVFDSFAGVNPSWHHSALSADWGWALGRTAAGTHAYILFNARMTNELISAKSRCCPLSKASYPWPAKLREQDQVVYTWWIFFWWMNGQFRTWWANPSPPGPDSSRVFYPTGSQGFYLLDTSPVNAFSAWLNTKLGLNPALNL